MDASELEARRLKLGGTHNYVILAGGEMIVARHGQAGLEHAVAANVVTHIPPAHKAGN